MEKLTEATINNLIESRGKSLAVTIYMPLQQSASPANLAEDQIRFKNLIHQAIDKLSAYPQHAKLEANLLATLEDFKAQTIEYENHCPGLFACVTDKVTRIFALPIDTDEHVAIDYNFHLAPILGIMQDGQDYLVLSVAQHHPKLFTGDMYNLKIHPVSFPESLESGLQLDEASARTENAQSAGAGSGGFNGRGGAKEPQQQDRIRFWRMVDKILHDNTERSLPLVLMGTDSEIAEYRSISKHPHILQAHISGSHQDSDMHGLFRKVQAIIQSEIIDERHQAITEEYKRLKGTQTDRVAADTMSIATAAEQGRVDTLLVRMSQQTADTVRDNLNAVTKLVFPKGDMDNIMNDIVIKVRQMSGRSIAMSTTEMPNGTQMAAIMRY